jgi:hypothetical protein
VHTIARAVTQTSSPGVALTALQRVNVAASSPTGSISGMQSPRRAPVLGRGASCDSPARTWDRPRLGRTLHIRQAVQKLLIQLNHRIACAPRDQMSGVPSRQPRRHACSIARLPKAPLTDKPVSYQSTFPCRGARLYRTPKMPPDALRSPLRFHSWRLWSVLGLRPCTSQPDDVREQQHTGGKQAPLEQYTSSDVAGGRLEHRECRKGHYRQP